MSIAKLVNEGKTHILDILFGDVSVLDSSLFLGLYKNPVEPADAAALNDLQEVSGSGYVRHRLYKGTWVVDVDMATYEVQTFLAQGGDWGPVTGYFLATSLDNSGVLLAVEHFAEVFNILAGKGIKITPKMSLPT